MRALHAFICVKCSCSDNEKYISLSLYCMAQSSDCNGWFAKWLIINLLLAIFYRYFSRLLVGKNNIDNWQIWRVGFIFIKVHRDPIPRWGQLIALSWKHFTQFPAADLVSIDIKYIIHHKLTLGCWVYEKIIIISR